MKAYLEQLKKKNKLRTDVCETFRKNGYVQMDTSYFEFYEDFRKFNGRTPLEQTVKVINGKGEIAILRPDITFNIMRELAPDYDESVVKLYYDAMVFENSEAGILEKRQLGIEYFGNISIDADVEVIKLGMSVMPKEDTVFVIGHTKYLEGLLKDIFEKEAKQLVKEMIYRKQPQQLREFLSTLDIELGIKEKLLKLVEVEALDLEALTTGYINADMKMALSEMDYLIKQLPEEVMFDLSLLSKFEYYDGIIFKGFIKGVNAPVLRGGRYDKLSRVFKKAIPAVGLSVDFDQLLRGDIC